MNIRFAEPRDLPALKLIHSQFYEKDFPFPNLQHFIGTFVVTDDNDRIITFGGVRYLLEAVALTNKNFSPRQRKAALNQLLYGLGMITQENKFDKFHVFITESDWKKHLLKSGFNPCVGEALYIDVE